uniref:non-specific serine/threonine protein kinase n=1 Tax=Chenopodium quinoa TaxID=63459 RepID=A0A803LL36_CHEQI
MGYVHTIVLFLSWVWVLEQFDPAQGDITATQSLRDPDTLVSSDSNFKFGFFSPIYSTNRYVGIWYNKGVADHLEVRMVVTSDGNTSTKPMLTSWKSASNPSNGRFTAGLYRRSLPEFFIWDGDHPYWRSGPWDGRLFMGVQAMFYSAPVVGFRLETDSEGILRLSYSSASQRVTEHYVLTYDGMLSRRDWEDDRGFWTVQWQSLQYECDVYGKCGEFGSCNSNNLPICSCLRGFEPRNHQEWSAGNWSDGCVRRTPLQCEIAAGKENGFFKLRNVKVPDNAARIDSDGEEDCRRQCLGNCSCLAFAYNLGFGCMIWSGNLIDIADFSPVGVDIFVRLADSELGKTSKWKVIIAVIVIMGTTVSVLFMFCLWKLLHQRYGKSRKTALNKDGNWHKIGNTEFQDLPLLKFENLVIATDNFSERNKLGQGGFGPVYKGKFEDGQMVAVKRLSRASGQGLQEFMNEVVVISKLQHRNLVRLLGCCVEGEEKLLVYEYMPNKSLDALLFNPSDREQLDWKKRFNIIKAISRGLLYLHRDSRLRIIHRDLKASNILLDDNLNPKISDFGMARIFGGNQDQGDTKRIVGTYGYMSPEYAMEGRFSEKSDVFSFGVLLLEIVSGRRNSSFKDEESLGLIGHAWNLWNEDDIFSLIDPAISESTLQAEILSCARNNITTTQSLRDPDTIDSSDGNFKFGFFSLINSTDRYVGIWFDDNHTATTPVVASWKSASDPSVGRFTAGFNHRGRPEIFVWDGGIPYWRSGPWYGDMFLGVRDMYNYGEDDGFHIDGEIDGTFNLSFSSKTRTVTEHYVLNYDGLLLKKYYMEADGGGIGLVYGGNWSSGCKRKKPLQFGTVGREEDGFFKYTNMKVPDNSARLYSDDEYDCRKQCLGNRKCLAYAYYPGLGCMVWNETLIDIQEFSYVGVDLFIRLAHPEIGVTRIMRKKTLLQTSIPKEGTMKVEVGDLPVFGLENLAIATGHFQDLNKLGRGGFGAVYKGILEDGQEIAVKRLSKGSGQGLKEFMTEVLVISKLQHRNLVKLLGCCTEGKEKMLVYEYMPNKSLDALLFDPTYQKIFDWKRRFNVILGICRGLLYLHRDSRLRIIHRDLKASNILLDDNLNPKISDFGMARIFGGNQDQGDTKRIVGTYGYMSPEYAMEGRFSEKSDVFSLGVLLLEIVSGRRNNCFKEEDSLSLLIHAWKLWNEGNILSLIDPAISETTLHSEVLKCVQLGLLCVQEFPDDRPSASMVLSMIESEVTDLPCPSQPGFTQRRVTSRNEAQLNDHENGSVNHVSITALSGR